MTLRLRGTSSTAVRTSPPRTVTRCSSQAGSIQARVPDSEPAAMDVRQQHLEPALPLAAPDLRSHLDGVVMRDDDAAQAVAQRVGALTASWM